MDEAKEKELNMVKVMLRSVLTSSKGGVPAHVLQRDYREATFESLPFQKFGFRNLDEFIESIPDVVRIQRTPTGEVYHAVADESTAHISKMVSKQRSTKKRKSLKPARRRPAPRSAPFRSPWTAQQHIYLQPLKPWPGKRPMRGRSPPKPHEGHLTIQAFGGQRRVNVPGSKKGLLTTPGSQPQSSSASRYEVPPRFLKQQLGGLHQSSEQHQGQSPKKASPPRTSKGTPSKKQFKQTKVQPVDMARVQDGKRYYDTLIEYCRTHNIQDLKFGTVPSRIGDVYCYTSSTTINNRVYGSGDLFGSSVEAEFAACRTACQELGLLNGSVSSGKTISTDSGDHQLIKGRVKEMLQTKPNGLWKSRLPVEYKERFKEDPPGNLQDLVKTWTDIASFEYNNLTKMEVFYPVKDSPAPTPGPAHKTQDLKEIPMPSQASPQRKDFRIPNGKPLPLGENVVVFITFIQSPSCFCVQVDGCPIDEIADQLAKIAQDPVPEEKDLIRGRHTAALYSEDGSWYRAEIISDSPNNSVINVLYVDYGNNETCKTCDTRWLSEKLATYSVQAVYCSLYGIQTLKGEDDWSPELSEKFAELVRDEALVAVTQNYTEDGICEVELYLKDDMSTSINQKLIQLGLVREITESICSDVPENEPEPLKFPDENEWDVYISFINQSSNSVVIRLVGENYSEKLDEYDNKLEEAYKSNKSKFTVEEDELYIAMVDELYHRVRILSLDNDVAECYFLDHGDTDKVSINQLRPLDPVVNKLLPYQAVEISLYGLEEISTNPTTLDRLLDLALGKTCVAEVVSREEGLSVILYDTGAEEDININEVIAKAVMEETEARMMAEGIFQPATVSAETSPVKSLSSKPTNLEQAIDRLKLSGEQDLSENEEEVDNDEESWETEEEEEVVPVKQPIKKKDKNSNTVSPSANKNLNPNVTSGSTANVSDNVDKKAKSKSPEPETKNLYSWGKSSPDQDYMDDTKALWDTSLYWKRPLPPKLDIPPSGEYLDCHVCKIFDPGNFVCIPYGSMTVFDQMLRDCIEYYNIQDIDRVMQAEDIKVGHLYAGHQGGAWYRVLINKVVGPGLVSVYIVDFGEYNAMALEEIKPLPWKFWSLPFQAFKCRLYGIMPSKGSKLWSEGAKLKMKTLTEEKDLVGLVCGTDGSGTVSLRLVDTSSEQDICVDEVLIDLGMADVSPSN